MYSDGRRRLDSLSDDEGRKRRRRSSRSPPQYFSNHRSDVTQQSRRVRRNDELELRNRVDSFGRNPRRQQDYRFREQDDFSRRAENDRRRGVSPRRFEDRRGRDDALPRQREREASPRRKRAPQNDSYTRRREDTPPLEREEDSRSPPPPRKNDHFAPPAPRSRGEENSDRMARLFEEIGVATIAEYNQVRKERGEGVVPPKLPPAKATQAEIDEVLPVLQPLPDSYQQAILAIPGCLKHVDTRHIKTLLRLSPQHAMAALHEFREAMEDVHANIRNTGGYMMGVLRKYLPGELASGMTYDGTAVSELEKSMLDTETFADPWKKEETAVTREEDENRRREEEEAARLRKSPKLPSDIHDVRRLVKRKAKEASRWRPVSDALQAWQNVDDDRVGGERIYPDGADAPLTFSKAVIAKPLAWLVGAMENPPNSSLHADQFTARRTVVYRYDARTALVHEHGAIAAPFVKPHDRATIVAWRRPPPSFQAAPGSWMRLRFSVSTALVPEQNKATRAAVPVHVWLLEPLEGAEEKTRCTTWGVEELPSTVPHWLNEAATFNAKRAAADLGERIDRWLYKMEDPTAPALPKIPTHLPHDWIELADREDNNNSNNAHANTVSSR